MAIHISEIEVRKTAVKTAQFEDDGMVPNSRYQVLMYPKAFDFGELSKKAAKERLKATVAKNNWYLDWGWYIYSFLHYHSTAHEGLVIFSGEATIQLGGRKVGEKFKFSAGDVLVIPAGVGHERLEASDDFFVFGIYPKGQTWDFISEGGQAEGKDISDPDVRREALENIKKLPLPTRDPLYGQGPLLNLWQKK